MVEVPLNRSARMRQRIVGVHYGLGEPGGPGCEHDPDNLIRARPALEQRLGLDTVLDRIGQDLIEADAAVRRLTAGDQDMFQARQLGPKVSKGGGVIEVQELPGNDRRLRGSDTQPELHLDAPPIGPNLDDDSAGELNTVVTHQILEPVGQLKGNGIARFDAQHP